jgi:hypothetical protein
MIARLVKIEACIGGTGSVHSRKIQGVRSFTLYLSISTSFSLLCDYGLDWTMLLESKVYEVIEFVPPMSLIVDTKYYL